MSALEVRKSQAIGISHRFESSPCPLDSMTSAKERHALERWKNIAMGFDVISSRRDSNRKALHVLRVLGNDVASIRERVSECRR